MDVTLTIFTLLSMGAVLVVAVALAVIMPNAHTDWLVKLDACIAWVTALSMLVLVPIDVAGAINTSWHKYRHDQMLEVLWNIFFWNGLLMQITVLPFHQEYADSGGLTMCDRIQYSLLKNVVLYLVLLLGGGTAAGLTILSGQTIQWHWWFSVVAAAGNAFGLCLGLLLMSYGLVEIPKRLWYLGNLQAVHQSLYHRAGVHHANAVAAKRELLKCRAMAANANRLFHRADPLKRHVEEIERMAAQALPPPDPISAEDVAPELNEEEELDYDFLSSSELAGLRRKVRIAIEEWERCVARYIEAAREYVELEDVLHNCEREGMRFQSSAPRGWTRQGGRLSAVAGHAEWWWLCRIKPLLFRICAVLTGLLSLAIVVAEATISPLLPNLSIFSQLMHRDSGLLQTMLICMFSLAYPVVCAYYTLFKLGQTQYFLLVPRHTSPHSLLMHATLMCRFAAPLAFNFMMAVALPSSTDPDVADQTHTVFYQTIGVKMIRLPIIGFELTTYLPTMMGLMMVLMVLNIPNRLALFFMPRRRIRVIASDEWNGDVPPGPAREARKLLAAEHENYKIFGRSGLGRGTIIHEKHFPRESRNGGANGSSLATPLLHNWPEPTGADVSSDLLGARARTPATLLPSNAPSGRETNQAPPLLQANMQAKIPRRRSGEQVAGASGSSSGAGAGLLSSSAGGAPSPGSSFWFQKPDPSTDSPSPLVAEIVGGGPISSTASSNVPIPRSEADDESGPLTKIFSKMKEKRSPKLKTVISFTPDN